MGKKKKKTEVSSVSWSMGVLVTVLVFIYLVFFGVHGETVEDTVKELELEMAIEQQQQVEKREDTNMNWPQKIKIASVVETIGESEIVSPAPQNTAGKQFYSVQELFAPDQIDTSWVIMLDPEMWLREWYMKSLHAAGLGNYGKYILKDMDNTHYVFLGSFDIRQLPTLIGSLWWNVVEISDENAINQHNLFWETVVFINLPAYQDIKVLMVIVFDGGDDVWFMQIDKDVYYEKKSDFTEIFGRWYTR